MYLVMCTPHPNPVTAYHFSHRTKRREKYMNKSIHLDNVNS